MSVPGWIRAKVPRWQTRGDNLPNNSVLAKISSRTQTYGVGRGEIKPNFCSITDQHLAGREKRVVRHADGPVSPFGTKCSVVCHSVCSLSLPTLVGPPEHVFVCKNTRRRFCLCLEYLRNSKLACHVAYSYPRSGDRPSWQLSPTITYLARAPPETLHAMQCHHEASLGCANWCNCHSRVINPS